jgi:leader peptidase (prepilin peptidase)/N-methyltransferase
MDGPDRLALVALTPDWIATIPTVFWVLWVFLLGLGIGSFLNVLIARLPFEKSVLWPGSHCGACLRPIRFADNLPILGYLRLRGRCRFCKSPFSSRYLWVELFTGLAFVGLYLAEVVANVHHVRPFAGVAGPVPVAVPPLSAWLYFAAHAFLLAMLIASAVIDIDYRIIPTHVTYVGTLIGLGVSVLFPWPWPHAVTAVPPGAGWNQPVFAGKLPTGLALWPAWEPPGWAPPGSWQLGLLTGVVGALAGMFVIRALKFLFEFGFGQEAVGLGDADLLMMAGAFLGWQPVVVAFFIGAVVSLPVGIAFRLAKNEQAFPFGPGLALGVFLTWMGWPWLRKSLHGFLFEEILVLVAVSVMAGGLFLGSIVLRIFGFGGASTADGGDRDR